jgi:hypothetical protein
VEREIITKFNKEDILNYFLNKGSMALSLKIAIRDILEKDIPLNKNTKLFFAEILSVLEREENSNSNNNNISNNINNISNSIIKNNKQQE